MRLGWPAAVPPIFSSPAWMRMPQPPFGTGRVPVTSVPILFPRTRPPSLSTPELEATPSNWFPEITLSMTSLPPVLMRIPVPLGSGSVPVTSVPMKLPRITMSVTQTPQKLFETLTPMDAFPEITLRADADAPPIVTLDALKQKLTPVWLPPGAPLGFPAPLAAGPMKLPWIACPELPDPTQHPKPIWTPELLEMTFR